MLTLLPVTTILWWHVEANSLNQFPLMEDHPCAAIIELLVRLSARVSVMAKSSISTQVQERTGGFSYGYSWASSYEQDTVVCRGKAYSGILTCSCKSYY
ncbi:hypothetical protein AVEN_54788-1 [Araneus ventricosus]|uniref:Secreted protein n=1 Tax=Araneus ventricosus TaxID=182803 RepID=A0A4Y2LNE5_ARAVE|nr:hypothetical protein AVEN_54788-1 [Araneus ventricosus]